MCDNFSIVDEPVNKFSVAIDKHGPLPRPLNKPIISPSRAARSAWFILLSAGPRFHQRRQVLLASRGFENENLEIAVVP